MARTLNKLSARGVAAAKDRGLHGDGGGLYLRIDEGGAKRWVFIWRDQGRRREMGLGSAISVDLRVAREAASVARAAVAAGRDPIVERNFQAVQVPLFGPYADSFLTKMKGAWRGDKNLARWTRNIEVHAKPIRKTRVDQIDTQVVVSLLKPMWADKPETAMRLRSAVERVLDSAKVDGFRSGENPARWRGHLEHVLPAPKKLRRGHHAAMPYAAVPAFVAKLRAKSRIGARLVEFQILTAARPSEAREATKAELDLPSRLWVIPAPRMKEGVEHRVPLCARAVQIAEEVMALEGPWLFPGWREGRPLSNTAGDGILKDNGADAYTMHGFRSSFRDWVGEETDFPRELAEAALAHKVGNEVERAYRRGDALEKRRALMNAWASYVDHVTPPSQSESSDPLKPAVRPVE